MDWTNEKKGYLETMYNRGMSDTELATNLGTTVYAVARMRSTLGLVAHKVTKHIRSTKTVVTPTAIPDCIAVYVKDGRNHILQGSLNTIKTQAPIIMRENNLKSLVVYKPSTQLVLEQVKEINLS